MNTLDPFVQTEINGREYVLGLRGCNSVLFVDGVEVYNCGPYRSGASSGDDASIMHDLAGFLSYWAVLALSYVNSAQYCDVEDAEDRRADFDCDDQTVREIASVCDDCCDMISFAVDGKFGLEG